MVLMLVNYQGSEIIGIAAGESQCPEKPYLRRSSVWLFVFRFVYSACVLFGIGFSLGSPVLQILSLQRPFDFGWHSLGSIDD